MSNLDSAVVAPAHHAILVCGKDGTCNGGGVTLVHIDGVDGGPEVPHSEGRVSGTSDDERLGGVHRGICNLLVVPCRMGKLI